MGFTNDGDSKDKFGEKNQKLNESNKVMSKKQIVNLLLPSQNVIKNLFGTQDTKMF